MSTLNVKGNRKVLVVQYAPPQAVFKIPDGLDLEDKSIVSEWDVKWNRLFIRYVDENKPDEYIESDSNEEIAIRAPEHMVIENANNYGVKYNEGEFYNCESDDEDENEVVDKYHSEGEDEDEIEGEDEIEDSE